jgi:hypothetical protein
VSIAARCFGNASTGRLETSPRQDTCAGRAFLAQHQSPDRFEQTETAGGLREAVVVVNDSYNLLFV